MANLSGHQTVYGTFSNDAEWHKYVYDFSVDGGSSLGLGVFTAGESLAILDYYGWVETAVTGAHSVSLGVGASGTDFHSTVAVSSFAVNSLLKQATRAIVAISPDQVVTLQFKNADATAGKFNMNFLVKKLTK